MKLISNPLDSINKAKDVIKKSKEIMKEGGLKEIVEGGLKEIVEERGLKAEEKKEEKALKAEEKKEEKALKAEEKKEEKVQKAEEKKGEKVRKAEEKKEKKEEKARIAEEERIEEERIERALEEEKKALDEAVEKISISTTNQLENTPVTKYIDAVQTVTIGEIDTDNWQEVFSSTTSENSVLKAFYDAQNRLIRQLKELCVEKGGTAVIGVTFNTQLVETNTGREAIGIGTPIIDKKFVICGSGTIVTIE
jgi:uncharacterized protein YbjQ (UPF0145 family)